LGYQVLVVDDDRQIRLGVEKILLSKCKNIESVILSSNGAEALEKLKNTSPDLAIVDIRMPLMDGLEFIKHARELNDTLKYIILSGYSDFAYAQQCISLGCSRYLLKPFHHEELVKTVDMICSNSRKKEEDKTLSKSEYTKLFYSARDSFLIDLSKGIIKQDELKEQLARYNLEFMLKSCYCAVMNIDNFRHRLPIFDSASPLKEELLLTEGLLNATRSYLDVNAIQAVAFKLTVREIAILITSVVRLEYVEKILECLSRIAIDELNISVTTGYCPAVFNPADISNGISKARRGVDKRFYQGKGNIYRIGKEADDNQYFESYPYKHENELFKAISIGDIPRIRQGFYNIISYFIDVKLPKEECLTILKKLYACLRNSINDIMQLGNSAPLATCSAFNNKLESLDTIGDIRSYIINILEHVEFLINDKDYSNMRKIIMKALQYINSHYRENISLNDVARYINVSPSYFSVLFKKNMGKTFTDYLCSLRIYNAQLMLQDPICKIYEIAQSVGYDDYRHFSKVFKRFTGMTPTEYREKSINKFNTESLQNSGNYPTV
jgi:two-component system response regulator YesN